MKKLLILSGKGGTGKTSVAASLIKLFKAKAIADCDVDAPNLHLLSSSNEKVQEKEFIGSEKAKIDHNKCINCGLCKDHCRFNAIKESKEYHEIKAYACEGCGVCEYVCPSDAITMVDDVSGNLYLYKGEAVFSTAKLKMGRGNSGKLVSAVKNQLDDNVEEADLEIIDGSPGIGCPVIASISGVDIILIVAEPSLSGISDLKRIVQTAKTFNPLLAVCVNKYDISLKYTNEIREYCNLENIAFVGKIPYDSETSKLMNEGKCIVDGNGPAKDGILEIYNNIKLLINEYWEE